MGHYPPSFDDYRGQATIYGDLPIHGDGSVAIVLHTTETRGMPGFNNGDTAPHYVYHARDREWFVWAEFEDGYVGTMKGHSAGGHSNCKAFQVEIIAYSDEGVAHDVDGLWVGDFTDEQYQDLAEFVAWARDRYSIGDDVTPTPDGGWLYGTGSALRLTESAYAAFSGLTAHGAVPNQTHWDTGVLDLARIDAGAISPPDPDPDPDPTIPLGRECVFVTEGQSGQAVEYWQAMSVCAVEGIPFDGNSCWAFIEQHAPTLTPGTWDQAMTDYLSAWTGRNSYGIGATERMMIETEVYT